MSSQNAAYNQPEDESVSLGQRLLTLPRLLRIAIVLLLAIGTTLAIFPLVDRIYIQYFFASDTVILPSLVSAAVGALMYVSGWQLYVGTVGHTRPATRALWLYFAIGIAALLIDIGLIVQGISMLPAIAG